MDEAIVTGGAGFIGSHLADLLLERGVKVYAIDDLSTGTGENVAHLESDPDFELIEADVVDYGGIDYLARRADAIFHLAAAVGVKQIIDSPSQTIRTNIDGTERMLEAATEYDCSVLIASTSEVYGKSSSYPFSEGDDIVLGPTTSSRWSYAASKIIDEHLALAYARQYDVSVVITRLFNTVGPRQTGEYGMVIPTFVEQALAGDPITVYGDGTQKRAFTAVSDVVEALYDLIRTPEASGEIFNLGTTEEVSIRELAERVQERTESDSPIEFVDYEEAYEEGFEDPDRRLPDISKVREYADYTPSKGLNEILNEVIAERRDA